jgi:hypothetical protein
MRICFGGGRLIPCVIIVIITVHILHYGSRKNCEVIILIILQLNKKSCVCFGFLVVSSTSDP